MKTIFSGPKRAADSSIHMLLRSYGSSPGRSGPSSAGATCIVAFDAAARNRSCQVDGFGEEGRLVKRKIKLKPGAARQTGFCKDQVATARPATDRQVARTDTGLGQGVGDRVPRNRLLVCREPRLLSSCGINHVAAEKQHVAGRRAVLICRHR
jgi:hypothetical protein